MVTVAKVQRVKAGLSQNELSKIVGCSRRWLSRLERGLVGIENINYWRGAILEAVLGVPLNTLSTPATIDDSELNRGGENDNVPTISRAES